MNTVHRYTLRGIGALNFVMHGALGSGLTRSLALDAHGKCLSSAILKLEIPDADVPSDSPASPPGLARPAAHETK
jgi:hypothetical protein